MSLWGHRFDSVTRQPIIGHKCSFLTLEGCHGDHHVGLFELPQKVVSHFKIGPETKKLRPFKMS